MNQNITIEEVDCMKKASEKAAETALELQQAANKEEDTAAETSNLFIAYRAKLFASYLEYLEEKPETFVERYLDYLYTDIDPVAADARDDRRKPTKNMRTALPDACVACGVERNIEHHHIIPYQEGGKTEPVNLAPLCGRCHKSISTVEYAWETSELNLGYLKKLETIGAVGQ